MSTPVDIADMLDKLVLPVSVLRWKAFLESPEFSDFMSAQLLREVTEPQCIETMNNYYRTNLRLSRLIDRNVLVENLVTGSRHRYNNDVVQQLLSFRFVEERPNVGISGITEAGKSYFMAAFCNEAYHKNYRCMYGLETNYLL